MPSPVLNLARSGPRRRGARRGLMLTPLVALAVTTALTGCTSSAPSPEPTTAAGSTATAPQPTETLLEDTADQHSAVGAVPEGFPHDLLPTPEDAEILVSTMQPVEGADLTTISLNLRSAQDAAALVDGLRQPLLASGFAEATPAQAEPGLAAQTTFVRGDGEMLLVGVLDRDGVRTLTLGGRLRLG
ncbi:hypothetical protein [Cellulomonas chengniuliangii]|uniref:Lipoprotein n=1 Tax=Cellulomonas chengniuliangii TaxID=2968084 RepID=A0ABY5KW71_9CELL|nr:hypothetical protein [Cellulomonas chengniuliangii]MCC2308590.1 hypothetical protein [Cellulomonas chengniuliangii]MCC2317607.1 hypothetical protein [Cellulomonas chengniuliangii]UUI73953.1 hypothetical protein NP064_08830 [Cellulomonas chengniuliangii]